MSSINIIKGLSSIVNTENIKNGLDLREIEKNMINNGLMSTPTIDPQDKLNKELQNIAEKIGIPFNDEKTLSVNLNIPKFSTNQNNMFEINKSGNISNSFQQTPVQYNSPKDNHSNVDSANFSPLSINSNATTPIFEKNTTSIYEKNATPIFEKNTTSIYEKNQYSSNLTNKTNEEIRKQHIHSIINEDNKISQQLVDILEHEKKEDEKNAMLADIDSLTTALEDDNVDLTRIPKVCRESSYDDVKSVYRILYHKYDHSRYRNLAEEGILFIAYTLEELFDGKKLWFGRSPDLTGWHNNVNMKMRRMRHDMGSVVSNVMKDYNVGPTFRILAELVPNAVVYSQRRKQNYGQSSLDIDSIDAVSRLNSVTRSTRNLDDI